VDEDDDDAGDVVAVADVTVVRGQRDRPAHRPGVILRVVGRDVSTESRDRCADCGRTFCAAIGLFSRKGIHRGSADLTLQRVSWSSSNG